MKTFFIGGEEWTVTKAQIVENETLPSLTLLKNGKRLVVAYDIKTKECYTTECLSKKMLNFLQQSIVDKVNCH